MPMINESFTIWKAVDVWFYSLSLLICQFAGLSLVSLRRLDFRPPFLLVEALNTGMQQKLQKHVIFDSSSEQARISTSSTTLSVLIREFSRWRDKQATNNDAIIRIWKE